MLMHCWNSPNRFNLNLLVISYLYVFRKVQNLNLGFLKNRSYKQVNHVLQYQPPRQLDRKTLDLFKQPEILKKTRNLGKHWKISKILKLVQNNLNSPWHSQIEVNMVEKANGNYPPSWTHSNLRPSRFAAGKNSQCSQRKL